MKNFILLLSLFCTACCHAQYIHFDSAQVLPDGNAKSVNDTIHIDKITVANLAARMKEDRRANPKLRLQIIVSSSYGCRGNIFAMEYVNEMVPKYGDSIQLYYILGDVQKDKKEYRAAAQYLAAGIQFYSAGEQYRDPEDERGGPDTLTKQLFPETASDVIGTPKFLIYDVKKQQLVFHGFRGYQNPFPEDIVTYFFDKTRKRRR